MSDDHELMRRCGEGDMTALEILVRRWEDRVDAMCRRLVPCPSDSHDLKQDVFVRLLQASPRYDANGAFSTWLYRIVLNLARDKARRRRIRRTTPLPVCELVDRNGSPASDSQQSEMRTIVDQAVRDLPAELKEVVVLRHYGEMPFARIAQVLNQPASTIKSRMKTALKQLHADLRQRGIIDGDEQ
ncbi:MAG: sigma-70 family RNA polymerase sigma factor [Pirellulales bacterium]|nr:sigma-70 family RNA polymerase sigma factor [Pirellulales bacterium]